MRFNFHLPYSNFHLPLKNCFMMFHLKPSSAGACNCESIFSRMPDHKTSISKHTIYIYSVLAQWGKQDTVFTCPSAIIYKFYLPGAMGQAPMSSPVLTVQPVQIVVWIYNIFDDTFELKNDFTKYL